MTVRSAMQGLLSNAARTADARHMQQACLEGSQPCSLVALDHLEMEAVRKISIRKLH